jgi:hypothetical protein
MANTPTDFTIADYLWLSGEPGTLILVEESPNGSESRVRVSVLTDPISVCLPRSRGESLDCVLAKAFKELSLQAALGVSPKFFNAA